MGQLRNLLRGMAYDSDAGPAVLLSRLDAAMDGLQAGTLATAVLGRVEQHGAGEDPSWRLRWSNAGHPPPLLRRPDGSVEVLDGPVELLLGLDPGARRGERVVDLLPGSTLLLYSDGLVERRSADLDQGIDRLVEALARRGDADPEELCDLLLAEVGLAHNDDDLAMLVLRPGRSASSGAPDGHRTTWRASAAPALDRTAV